MTVLMESTASAVYHWSTGAAVGVCSCLGGRGASLLPEGKDHGYQSSKSPQTSDLRDYPGTERSNICMIDHDESNHNLDKSHVRGASGETLRVDGEGDGPLDTPEVQDKDPPLANPLLSHSIHERLWCCTNGYFWRTSVGPFSEFQSNCGCTSHNLVDWSTRPTWTNLTLRHQWKVREVTFLSPYRATGFQKVVPPAHHPESEYGLKRATQPTLQTLPTIQTLRRPQTAEKMMSVASVKQEMPTSPFSVNDERPFVCEESGCGRSFCRNEELTRHSRIHSGNRPFLCQKCGRRFVRRDHLTKHQRTHLPVQAKRSYTCPLPSCTHRYTRSDALTRHMWTAHHTRARQPSRPRARASLPSSSHTFISTTALSPRLPPNTCLSPASVPHTSVIPTSSRAPKFLLPSPLRKEP